MSKDEWSFLLLNMKWWCIQNWLTYMLTSNNDPPQNYSSKAKYILHANPAYIKTLRR